LEEPDADAQSGRHLRAALLRHADDIETRCFLDTSYDKVELGSRSGLAMNADGSADIYVAPRPLEGAPESNWIPSRPERAWFTYFRLYAPLQPYFDASWKLPDIEAV
jgi:hypothetical protein